LSDAVTVDEDGPKIRPELMETERIYHCIYKDVALLFFVDQQGFLNCYDIDEPDLVEKIKERGNIEEALAEYRASLGSE
jgi:hypothetical protein